jgi:membrane-associated phospholipid phosphatase
MESTAPLASAVGVPDDGTALAAALSCAVVVTGLLETRLENRARRNWRRIVGWGLLALLLVVGLTYLLLPDGTRTLGLTALLSSVPSSVLLAFGVVTQFGDPWFLVLVATAVYMVGTSRELVETPREGAFVLATTFGALATVDLLKHLFSLPRPEGATTAAPPLWVPELFGGVFRALTTGSGYAFPSGHALGTTAVFGALAYRLNVATARVRWAAAAGSVLLVVLSRLVLGVHFLVDVVAGVVGGLVLLGIVVWTGSERPIRAFAVAAAAGCAAVVVAALGSPTAVWESAQWLGAAVGAGVVWLLVRPSCRLDLRGSLVAGAVVAPIWIGTYLLEPGPFVAVFAIAVAAGITVGAPSLAERVEKRAEESVAG